MYYCFCTFDLVITNLCCVEHPSKYGFFNGDAQHACGRLSTKYVQSKRDRSCENLKSNNNIENLLKTLVLMRILNTRTFSNK